MQFYFVRHGEAVSQHLDPRRPLTDAGRCDVEQVARAAAAKNVNAAEILHSGLERARETAEILAGILAPAEGVRAVQGLQPEDDPLLLKVELELASTPQMLVGHLPYMNRLAGLLLHGDPERLVIDFGPATLVCCSRSAVGWKHEWTLTPNLR